MKYLGRLLFHNRPPTADGDTLETLLKEYITLFTQTTNTPPPDQDYTSTGVQGSQALSDGIGDMDCEKSKVITASLGSMTVILLLILVGVVTGWVWFCQRNKAPKQR